MRFGLRLSIALLCALAGCSQPDRLWEAQQRRHPVLYQLDNTDAKTHALHAAIAVAGGYTLALTPWITRREGMQYMVGWYFGREVYGIVGEGNRKYRDAAGDVLVPLVVVMLWPWGK